MEQFYGLGTLLFLMLVLFIEVIFYVQMKSQVKLFIASKVIEF